MPQEQVVIVMVATDGSNATEAGGAVGAEEADDGPQHGSATAPRPARNPFRQLRALLQSAGATNATAALLHIRH